MVRGDAPETTFAELRRGAIVVAVLASLRRERYGYALRETLAEAGLEVAEGTLYPLLRRLEAQDLLASRWDTSGARPRRYYRLAAEGEGALERLAAEWEGLVGAMGRLLKASRKEETA